MLYKALFTVTVIKSSCTQVTRWCASVIKVGVVHICERTHIKAFKTRAGLNHCRNVYKTNVSLLLLSSLVTRKVFAIQH